MPTRVYATADQVHTLVGITPDTASLRHASHDVDHIVKTAVYDVDSDGMPSDPDVADLLTEMVAEQIAWYQEIGDQTGVVAVSGGSIGQVSLPALAGTGSTAVLAPRAISLARDSDLLTWQVIEC